MKQILVSEELLRQVLVRLELGGPEWERDNMIKALRAALEQPAPVQEQQPAPASKPVLLQCLGCERVGTQEQLSASTDCDCWLHTQLAPVQEPVAWASQTALDIAAEGGEGIIVGAEADCLIPLYTVPQPVPVQEPAAEILSDVIHRNAKKLVFTHHGLSLPVGTKLYTATQPAPVQEPEKLNPLTQLQVAYVMGLRDSNSALQAQQPRKAVKLSDNDVAAIVKEAAKGSAMRRDGSTSERIARAIEAAVLKANGVCE